MHSAVDSTEVNTSCLIDNLLFFLKIMKNFKLNLKFL